MTVTLSIPDATDYLYLLGEGNDLEVVFATFIIHLEDFARAFQKVVEISRVKKLKIGVRRKTLHVTGDDDALGSLVRAQVGFAIAG